MKAKNLVGEKFGSLTVLGRDEVKHKDGVYWKCQCDCGNIIFTKSYRLTSGHTKSCGCLKHKHTYEDLTNSKFGYLTVDSFAYIKDKRSYWNGICKCGNTVVAMAKLLKKGSITSCGCKRKEIRKSLLNERFGHLLVIKEGIENDKTIRICKCDCGNIIKVRSGSLTGGNIKTCGKCMLRFENNNRENLKGKVFHHLTVLSYARTIGKDAFWNCKCKCGNKLIVKSNNLKHGYVKSCKKCAHSTSFGEKEVIDFVKTIYKGYVIENDKVTVAPKELDIYIPEKKFAIEYDGLYWHSEKAGKKQSYHWNKTKMCLEKGIRLLHIYENEWRDKQDICKSMIASALGIYERKEFARYCEVKEVTDKKVVIDFFNENHIQGAVHNYSLCLGLYKDGQLLQAVVFGKHHFGKKGTIELYRMVTKKNTQVIGGFSKLMKHSPYDTVVSYVALRLFDAKGYLAGNWKIEHRSQPSFDITDGANLYTRHLFKKERCLKMFTNVTEDMTEREMQIKNGFYRIWDCGTYKVVWNRP